VVTEDDELISIKKERGKISRNHGKFNRTFEELYNTTAEDNRTFEEL
jgi:hypothetical protein